jgi:glutamate-1-semialdehyde 2,1-aminomutase
MGCVPPLAGYLEGVRQITQDYGALLIFDEVMTGFRVDYHCAQGLYGIKPDLTCFGKIIGGGLPVGAYGGRRELMEQVAPSGPIYQAGTLSGNPLAMAAGLTTLALLGEEDYAEFDRKAERLLSGIEAAAAKYSIALSTSHVGGMMGVFFTEQKVINFDTAKTADTARFAQFFQKMLARGIYLPASQFETWFLSTKHSDADIEATIAAAENSMRELAGE